MNSPAAIAVVAVVMAGVAMPSDTAAQQRGRSGIWFEFGTGPAAVRVACATCTDVTRSTGSGIFLRVGGAISPKVLLGLEAYSLIDEGIAFESGDNSLVSENASLAAIVLWYPWYRRFFVKSGVGMASGEFHVDAGGAEPVLTDGLGVGLTFGLGLDQPLWRGIAGTANAGVWVTAIGDVVLPAATVDDVIATLYTVSLGVTIR